MPKIRSFAEQDKDLVLPNTDSILCVLDARLTDQVHKAESGRNKLTMNKQHSAMQMNRQPDVKQFKQVPIQTEWKTSNVNFSFNVGASGKDNNTFVNAGETSCQKKKKAFINQQE